MSARVEFTERPPYDELTAWQRWMRRHGIDPNDVPVGNSFVEVDGRVIRYTCIVRRDGQPALDRDRGEFVTEVRECQVYSRRPDPFPVETS